ncbi:MAG TPA: serine/threonine-protein kinase, partial [Polyangiales bacterium]
MPERIGRYRVHEMLGRGGMATVYRVSDESTGRECALKQLHIAPDDPKSATIVSLFEHEYRTLTELAHPRVIKVYDFGIADGGAYYTMELLPGGDLTKRAPLPWREACALFYDVCSSLALLHSRRLVHRDVSPHNVRCTPDGRAKLIDFGAMTTMGPVSEIVGTPPFVAPEVVSRGSIDGKTDLFSLGATLYFALTGRLPYQARSFADLLTVWTIRPVPPSIVIPDIPPMLDR